MAITFVNSAGLSGTNTTTAVSTAIPSGIQLGDLLVVFHGNANNYRRFSGHSTTDPTMATGWILVDNVTATSNVYFMVAMKTATSTEVAAAGSNLQIATLPNSTGSPRRTSFCVAYRGALPANQQPKDYGLNHVTRPTLPTCSAAGNSVDNTYLVTSDGAAAPFNTGDPVRIFNSTGIIKEQTLFTVTTKESAFGFTNISVTPHFAASPVTGDQLHVETHPDIDTPSVDATNARDWYVAGWNAYREQGPNTAGSFTTDAEVNRGFQSSQNTTLGSVTGASDSDGPIAPGSYGLSGSVTPWIIDDKNAWIGILEAAPEEYGESATTSMSGTSALSREISSVRSYPVNLGANPGAQKEFSGFRSLVQSAVAAPVLGRLSELYRVAQQSMVGSSVFSLAQILPVLVVGYVVGSGNLTRVASLARSHQVSGVLSPGIYKGFFETASSVASGTPALYAQRALLMLIVGFIAAVGSVGAMRGVLRQFNALLWGTPNTYKGFGVSQVASMAGAGSLGWLISRSREIIASLAGSPRLLRGLSQRFNVTMTGSLRHYIGQFREFTVGATGTSSMLFEGVVARVFTAIASGTPALASRLGKRLVASLTGSGSWFRSLSANRSYTASAEGTATVRRGFWQTFVSSFSGLPFADRGNNLVFQAVASGLASVRRGYARTYFAQLESSPAISWVRGLVFSVTAELLPTTSQLLMKTILVVAAGLPNTLIAGFTITYITVVVGLTSTPRVTKALSGVLVAFLVGAPGVVRDLLRTFSVGLQGHASLVKSLWKSFLSVAAGSPVLSQVLERVSVSVGRPARFRPKIRVVVYRKGTPLPVDESWTTYGFEVKWSSTAFDVGSSQGALDIGWSGELV